MTDPERRTIPMDICPTCGALFASTVQFADGSFIDDVAMRCLRCESVQSVCQQLQEKSE